MATENENWQGKPEEGASNADREGMERSSRFNDEQGNGNAYRPRRSYDEGNNSYEHRPRRSFGDNNDRPRFPRRDGESGNSYGDRPRFPRRDGDSSNSYGDRPRFPRRDGDSGNSFGDRPRFPRRDGDSSNSYGDRPRFPRRDGDSGNSFGDRPRFPRRDGDSGNSYGDRPRFPRRDGDSGNSFGDRPRFPRRDGDSGNSYGDRPRFPRRDGESGNSYGDRPRFPRRDGESGNSFGDRPRFPRRDSNSGNFGPRQELNAPARSDGRPRRPRIRKASDNTDWLSENEFRIPKYAPNLDPTTPIRLNRFLSNAGICSRREADEYIQAGVVKVNGEVASELGVKVLPTDEIMFHDQAVKIERKVYILLNKPKDCVTTSEDPQERLTVMDLVKNACAERIYPVGRLDRNTTGVLLLTNDGDLASKLAHPKYEKRKIYQATLDKDLTEELMAKIAEGVVLDGEQIAVDEISYVDPDKKNVVGIEIHSGQNRVVRRIFEQIGYKVFKLDRVYFAGLTKKNLPRGRWRHLTEHEVGLLKMGAFV